MRGWRRCVYRMRADQRHGPPSLRGPRYESPGHPSLSHGGCRDKDNIELASALILTTGRILRHDPSSPALDRCRGLSGHLALPGLDLHSYFFLALSPSSSFPLPFLHSFSLLGSFWLSHLFPLFVPSLNFFFFLSATPLQSCVGIRQNNGEFLPLLSS